MKTDLYQPLTRPKDISCVLLLNILHYVILLHFDLYNISISSKQQVPNVASNSKGDKSSKKNKKK